MLKHDYIWDHIWDVGYTTYYLYLKMDQSKRYILDYDNFVQTLARGTFTSKKS